MLYSNQLLVSCFVLKSFSLFVTRQLDWYSTKELELSESGLSFYFGEIAGYIEDITDPSVPPMIVKIDDENSSRDYYLFFNRAAGFNSGTAEAPNKVCITRYTGPGYRPSELVAKLSVGDTWVFPFGVGGQVTVNSIGTRASVTISMTTLKMALLIL